jgi:hypothetical protein
MSRLNLSSHSTKKPSSVQPMKIFGMQLFLLSPYERHPQQSSIKPLSIRRSNPLPPHNKAANRFTTRSIHAFFKRSMAASTRILKASTKNTLRGLGRRRWKRLFALQNRREWTVTGLTTQIHRLKMRFWSGSGSFKLGSFREHVASNDTSHNAPLDGSDSKRQPDLFLISSRTTKRDGKHNWTDIRVIGELKQSEISKEFKKELIWLCGYAREVFKSQPNRRLLHGFFIRGSIVELWVFDRSGPYSCEKFDIHKDSNRSIRVMVGYALMNDEELGMNTYIKEDRIGKYIMFKRDEKKEEKLFLEDRPIAFQRAIVCRGTTCYRAKGQNSKKWEFVVKFSWRSDKRRAEGDLLRLAKERNVWGVAHLFSHQDLEIIADLRQKMEFGRPRTFRLASENSFSESQSKTGNLSANILHRPRRRVENESYMARHQSRQNDQGPRAAGDGQVLQVLLRKETTGRKKPTGIVSSSGTPPVLSILQVRTMDRSKTEYFPAWSFPLQDGRFMNSNPSRNF